MRAFLRGLLFLIIGAAVGFAIGAGLSFLFEGSLHVVAGVVLALVAAIAAFSWGLAGFNTVTKGLVLLLVGGILGYVLGLFLDLFVSGSWNFTGSVASAFALLMSATAFFFGLYGYRGITRGLVWQVVGTLIGGFFVTGIRALLGLNLFSTFFFTEPAWVFGAFAGVISFVFGVGIVDDWMKWARGLDTPEHHEDKPGWEKYFGVSVDHKVIGIQYTVTALVLISVGGTFAMIFRTELAASQLQFLTTTFRLFNQNGPQIYNSLMSLHGMIMIVSILLGVSGIMNYVVPLLLGAQDMAFPRM